jgi:hypothetical protein
MKKAILIVLSILFILLGGCIAQPQQPQTWKAMSGSKANGTLTLAYEKDDFAFLFNAPPNSAQGQSLADARCKVWGYKKAQPFDFTNEFCKPQSQSDSFFHLKIEDNKDNNSCRGTMLITQEYQCEK